LSCWRRLSNPYGLNHECLSTLGMLICFLVISMGNTWMLSRCLSNQASILPWSWIGELGLGGVKCSPSDWAMCCWRWGMMIVGMAILRYVWCKCNFSSAIIIIEHVEFQKQSIKWCRCIFINSFYVTKVRLMHPIVVSQ